MAGEEYGDNLSSVVSAAIGLQYAGVKGESATATFNYETENGATYSVDYTLKFVEAAN